MKKPDEILKVLDQAQLHLDHCDDVDIFDLRGLMWDVILDVLDSVKIAEKEFCTPSYKPNSPYGQYAIGDILSTAMDYCCNNYGDD